MNTEDRIKALRAERDNLATRNQELEAEVKELAQQSRAGRTRNDWTVKQERERVMGICAGQVRGLRLERDRARERGDRYKAEADALREELDAERKAHDDTAKAMGAVEERLKASQFEARRWHQVAEDLINGGASS